jgi:hypothetical protein
MLTAKLPVLVYRLQLQRHQHTSGFTKPTLRFFYVPGLVRQLERADHALLCTPARHI